MKKFLTMLLMTLATISTTVVADEIDDALTQVASELNLTLPMYLDSVTRWDTSIYIAYENTFIYRYTILEDVVRSDFTNRDIRDFSQTVINGFCSDPDTRILLDYTSIEMTYYNINGFYLFNIEFDDRDC